MKLRMFITTGHLVQQSSNECLSAQFITSKPGVELNNSVTCNKELDRPKVTAREEFKR
jgi:hypothetical protein